MALTLPAGGYVKLHGLVGGAEHNGKVGAITKHEAGSGRYTVSLRDGQMLALKPANLLQMLPVKLAELQGEHAAHSGAAGTIFDYDAASGMYGVELGGSGDAIPVAAADAVLPDGSVVEIVGLVGAPQHNGALARLLRHDAEAGRYLAQLDGGKQLRLRRQNVRA